MPLIHGFKLIRDETIEEYNIEARLYVHERTGAELLSLTNDDENKVFGITFRTPPWDSTGVAHILEHSVLCGSRKYPVKEPFVELMKGSLQTFLNAFTYPDKTCYPVASQNLQDFYNLIDIYMDAALHPRLTRATFDQEAWHYELNDPGDELIYKGVVFNEMKGVYASADSLLIEHSQRVLFPETTYGVDYGGDPRTIPDLTWEQLTAFHRRYYHPGNSRIYFYGDDDPGERLRLMDAYLSEYEREVPKSDIPLHPPTPLPPRVTMPYPTGESDADRVYLTVNWRLPADSDPERALAFYLLDHILTETPASPLRKALIESGLGEDMTGTGLENQLREMYFSTGMKGVAPADEPRVIALIESTLRTLVETGIDPLTIEAALNTEEFHFRELNTGSYPRGLSLMITAMQTWLYGGDPLEPIRYQAPLAAIRNKLACGERYFENLIREFLIDNPYRTVLVLTPDADLKNRLDRDEKKKLAAIKAGWTPEQVEETVARTRELQRLQETSDSAEELACIPVLARSDLPTANKILPNEPTEADSVPLLFHDLFTQGISYLDLGFDLSAVPDEDLGLVPIWARALLETGTKEEDFVALTQRIGRLTGGIDPEMYTSSFSGKPGAVTWIFLRGKAVDEKLPALLDILDDVLRSARFDLQSRIGQLIDEEKSELESSIIPSGHRFVAQRLRASFLEADWVNEQVSGISYLQTLRTLQRDVEQDWENLHRRLIALHERLTLRSNLLVNLTAEGSTRSQAETLIHAFLKKRTDGQVTRHPRRLTAAWEDPEFLVIPAQVHYVGKSVNLYRHAQEIKGASLVVNRYLRTAWLWDKVRVQGGAYGAFSTIDYRSGQLSMVSYRDPNVEKTLAAYDGTGDFLRRLSIDDAEINRAVIGAIGDMDGYMLPDVKGFIAMGRHLTGDTDENRQQLREDILSVTGDAFHDFAHSMDLLRDKGRIVVMGSRESAGRIGQCRLTPVL